VSSRRYALYLGAGCAVILASLFGPFQFMVNKELSNVPRDMQVVPALAQSSAPVAWPPANGAVAFYDEMMELLTQPSTQTTEEPEPERETPGPQAVAPEPQATTPEQEVIREAAPEKRGRISKHRQASANHATSRDGRASRRYARERDRGEVQIQGRDGRRYRIDPWVRAEADRERSFFYRDRTERERPSRFGGRASRPASFGGFGAFTGGW